MKFFLLLKLENSEGVFWAQYFNSEQSVSSFFNNLKLGKEYAFCYQAYGEKRRGKKIAGTPYWVSF